jgi:arsenical pump membrane protein
MSDFAIFTTPTVFLLTVIFLIWHPRGMGEAFPTAFGALLLLAAGIVPLSDLAEIFREISGAVLTFCPERWLPLNPVPRSG